MTPTRPWRIVAEREINFKLHDKTFLVSTAFMFVLVIGALVFPMLVSGGNSDVGVLDDRAAAVVHRADQQGGELDAHRLSGMDVAEQQLQDGDLDAVLVAEADGFQLIGDSSVDSDIRTSLEQAAVTEQIERNGEAAGLTMDQLTAGSALSQRLLNPAPFPEAVTFALTFAFAFVFYVTALSFGMVLAQSVVQEKESRIVEILAAAIPVRALLAGKVVGNTVLALGQILLLTVTAIIGLEVTGRGDMVSALIRPAGWFAVFFLLGFVTLAGIWAVAGSMAARQEDLQSSTLPAQALLFIPLFVVLSGNDTLLNVASYVPIASSFAMPVRMLSGDVPFWQPLLAALLVLVTAVGLVVLAARLYERSLLQTQRMVSYRELLRTR